MFYLHISPKNLKDFDLILAMDRANYHDILALDPSGQYSNKVHLMCEYCSKYVTKEVPDPYYGGEAGFDFVIELLIDACSGLLDRLVADGSVAIRNDS